MAGEDGWHAWLSPHWHRRGRQGHRFRVGTDGAEDEVEEDGNAGYVKCSICLCDLLA